MLVMSGKIAHVTFRANVVSMDYPIPWPLSFSF